MAKKQLKKINQPKKYLQGGSNMGSVAMMKQTPYYLGQVGQEAAQEDLITSQNQILSKRQQALAKKQALKDAQDQQLDAAVQNSSTQLIQAAAADQKAGNLGKFMLPPIGAITPATTVNTGLVNPTTGKAFTMTLGKTTGGTQGVNFSNLMAQEGAKVVGDAGTAASGGMSALTSGLIGVAGNIAGTVIKNKTNDNSAYTATNAESTGNVVGSGVRSAATGFVLGNMILPGVGGAIGAGLGAGVGALKARKQNKTAEEEAARLQREQAAIQGNFQTAFINSRTYGPNPGFGLKASPNMPNEVTNQYFVGRDGGALGIQEDRRPKKVPGGQIVPIEGTDAVEFKGRSHKDGGIIIEKDANGNPVVEVEKDEVMLPLKMKDGKKQDYIFSEYLKLGGKSFAQRSKEILKGSKSETDLQQLAAMQEKMAGRNSETVAVAKYGGIPQYAKGGIPEKKCGPGEFYNAYTGTCEPFSFTSMTNMVTNKETPVESTNPSTADNWKKIAAEYISKKEGFQPKGSWDENAYRAGFGSDKVLRDGKLIPVTKGMIVTREEALATLETYSIDKYANQIAKDLGEENWNKLNDNQRAALTSLGYNAGAAFISKRGYGRKIKYYIEAGNLDAAGDVIYSQGPKSGARSGYLPALEKRRKEESNLFNSTQTQPNNQTSTQPVKKTEPAKKTLLPPPPVTSKVATLAERNNLPGIGSMQMNEELQIPEQPKSNITFDPTDTKEERLKKEKPAANIITDPNKKNKRPDGIYLTYNKDTETYTYRDGKGLEIVSGKNLNRLSNQMDALQPGASGFDTQLAEMEAPVQRQDLTGVKPNLAAITPTNPQTAADTQTVIAKQNGTANAPAEESSWIDEMWANQNAAGFAKPAAYNAPAGVQPTVPATNTQPAGSPPPPAAAATNGGPGTAPTINNQNTTFQYTAKTPGYLDYSDPNVAGGIWSGDRYNKEWKPLVSSTMADAAKADQIINYLTNYTGTDAADVKAKIAGKSREKQIAVISDLAADTKVGPFHNAVFEAMQQVNSGGGNVATNNPPVVPPVVPPSTTSGTTTETPKRYTACPPGTYLSTDGTCKQNPTYSKPYDGNIVAAAGAAAQLIPPIYAALNPYQRVGSIPGAPSVKGALLGRKNFNAERSQVAEMNTATNEAVTNANTGAAGFAIRQAAMAAANKQMLAIGKAEGEVNTELRGKEAVLGQDASKFNAENVMKRDMFNADLKQKQNQYVDERNVGIVDALGNRLAGAANTYNQYKATDHLARVTNANTHSLERDKMYESLLKDAQNKNSQFNGASDAELRRIAAGLVEEQMGGVGRTGGVRQYISRLGELKSARATKAKL